MIEKRVQTICFECHSRCGVFLDVEDGKITGIKGDKDHPFSRGYTCPKGRAVQEIIYHPERITQPMVRVGKKGEGRFKKVSWDKAYSVIAERLDDIRTKLGPESFAIGTGTTKCIPPFLHRFLSEYGSPNYFGPAHMSGGPVSMGGIATAGYVMVPDYANTKCMLIWAHNPGAAWPGLYNYVVKQGLKNGAKVIVVDPRQTSIAKKADYWFKIRPGTDVALILCFLNVIIRKKLYDEAFVDKWVNGFDQLREHVAEFTPERVAEITWLSAKEIEEAAVLFGSTKPACVGPGQAGASQAPHAFDLNRALTALVAITGNLEVPGGNPNYWPVTGKRSCYGSDFAIRRQLPREQVDKKIGLKEYPIMTKYFMSPPEVFWKTILTGDPYPVKGVGLFGSNAVVAYANTPAVFEALSALEFLFVAEYFYTPTTSLADVVLPVAHWSERDDVEDLLMYGSAFAQRKAVEPVPECRDEKQILIDLAKLLGLDGYWKSVEEALDYRLEYTGLTWEMFKERGALHTPFEVKGYEKGPGFRNLMGTGKVDLVLDLPEMGDATPLPEFKEPLESPFSTPELYETYPLILTTGGRLLVYYHSAHRNIPSLKKRAPDPQLDIHPLTAEEFGVEQDEWIWLETPRGKVEIKIRINEKMHPKVVHAPHGFWYGVENGWRRININMVTDNFPQCPVTGSVQTRALLCRIQKVDPVTYRPPV